MNTQTDLKLPKWPFFAGNFLLLALACCLYVQRDQWPMNHWMPILFVLAGAFGVAFGIIPFLVEYRAAVKMVETGAVVSTISQVQNLEEVVRHIGNATAQWQGVQDHSSRTAATAKELAERMTAETVAFKDFLQKANDSERANLRVEVEKLRRTEGDWLQVVVRMLDHTYALNQAAVRSGQPGLIEQLGQFQNACRDAARRVGLVPFIPAANDSFDPQIHQTPDSQAMSIADAKVRETIATGYTYQGQLLRSALVSLQNPPPPADATVVETAAPVAAIPETNGNPASATKQVEALEEQTLL